MKIILKISFSEKDAVKALAANHGEKIRWDAPTKTWFWEGDALPEFLRPYAQLT